MSATWFVVDGRPMLYDLDPTCLGPWQFDRVAVAIGEIRFGSVGDHRAHAAAYRLRRDT